MKSYGMSFRSWNQRFPIEISRKDMIMLASPVEGYVLTKTSCFLRCPDISRYCFQVPAIFTFCKDAFLSLGIFTIKNVLSTENKALSLRFTSRSVNNCTNSFPPTHRVRRALYLVLIRQHQFMKFYQHNKQC